MDKTSKNMVLITMKKNTKIIQHCTAKAIISARSKRQEFVSEQRQAQCLRSSPATVQEKETHKRREWRLLAVLSLNLQNYSGYLPLSS